MRTIKFRGNCSGKWYYGDYMKYESGSVIRVGDGFTNVDYAVSPASVGQFTGLKDKDGVEIYEGDILAWEDEFGVKSKTQLVKYEESTASFRLFNADGIITKSVFGEYTCHRYQKVIGNIYDNPELLKGV